MMKLPTKMTKTGGTPLKFKAVCGPIWFTVEKIGRDLFTFRRDDGAQEMTGDGYTIQRAIGFAYVNGMIPGTDFRGG